MRIAIMWGNDLQNGKHEKSTETDLGTCWHLELADDGHWEDGERQIAEAVETGLDVSEICRESSRLAVGNGGDGWVPVGREMNATVCV